MNWNYIHNGNYCTALNLYTQRVELRHTWISIYCDDRINWSAVCVCAWKDMKIPIKLSLISASIIYTLTYPSSKTHFPRFLEPPVSSCLQLFAVQNSSIHTKFSAGSSTQFPVQFGFGYRCSFSISRSCSSFKTDQKKCSKRERI